MNDTTVTIEHLTNSLYQIELWIKAVRQALSSLDPKMAVPVSGREAEQWKVESPILTGKSCPPPE